MVDRSITSTTSLELLLHEIESTPKEYWAELLDTLRQFRQKIPSATSPIVNIEQAKKNQAAINLLDSWLDEEQDASEHQQTWDFLKKALDEDRFSDRPLFP
jgi:ferritin